MEKKLHSQVFSPLSKLLIPYTMQKQKEKASECDRMMSMSRHTAIPTMQGSMFHQQIHASSWTMSATFKCSGLTFGALRFFKQLPHSVYLMSCRPYPHHNKAANGHLSIIHNNVLAHQNTVDSLLNILTLKYRFTILVIMDAWPLAVAMLLGPHHCFPHIQTQELEAVVPLIHAYISHITMEGRAKLSA